MYRPHHTSPHRIKYSAFHITLAPVGQFLSPSRSPIAAVLPAGFTAAFHSSHHTIPSHEEHLFSLHYNHTTSSSYAQQKSNIFSIISEGPGQRSKQTGTHAQTIALDRLSVCFPAHNADSKGYSTDASVFPDFLNPAKNPGKIPAY